jgi:opacity protein-like surface antigen
MKKMALILSCCALGMSASTASAAGMYVSGNAGFALANTLTTNYDDSAEILSVDMDFDTGWALTGAFGYDFDGFRTEFEMGYQQSNSKEADWSLHGRDQIMTFGTTSLLDYDLTATTYLANGYYDFKNNSPFTPFLGAGLGMVTVEINDFSLGMFDLNRDFDDTVFAYQISAGVSYAFSKNFAMDLTYRYLGADDPKYDGGDGLARSVESEFGSNNFMLGGRLAF